MFFGVLFFLLVGIEVSYGGWIFTYTITSGIGLETQASFITSMFWLAITLGRLIAIPVSARVRPVPIIGIDLLSAFVCLGIICLGSGSLWAVSLGTIGLGLSIASMFPTTFSLAERHLNISGNLTGWLWAFGSAGGILIPWLIGKSIEMVNPAAMMIVLWSGVGLALAVFAGLMYYSRRVTTPK
jgi:FHS family Na+ dependent glucose MFS transporter 1